MTLHLAGHEFEPEDPDAEFPSRAVSDILDEVGRDTTLGKRIRREAEAKGLDPETAVLVDPEAAERIRQEAYDLREAHAELQEVAVKALKGRYGWSASAVAELTDAEAIEALAIEEHYDPTIDLDADTDLDVDVDTDAGLEPPAEALEADEE